MRKLWFMALFIVALVTFAGASAVFAGDCCKPKCKQVTCTKPCKQECNPCKPKCSPCKPKCESPCKPKCESPCKPKCDPCKPKCSPCKPKCESPCKPKCSPCKPKCKQNTCSKPCGDKCGSCKPKCGSTCKPKCGSCDTGCGPQTPKRHCNDHPYANCWNGSGNLCDGGPCEDFSFCKRVCETCTTTCKEVERCGPCGQKYMDYEYETVCTPIERPTVIPWWFYGSNIFLEPGETFDPASLETKPAAE